MKTTRTHFFATVRKAFNLALRAEKLQTDTAEVIGQAKEAAISRRKFLKILAKPCWRVPSPQVSSSTLRGRSSPRSSAAQCPASSSSGVASLA
ncbi:MAG: hypothetical protein IPM82_10440 [Saprospiraceae bacterium]|nr:hypothetical protein [Saprospiraceae bacterium]